MPAWLLSALALLRSRLVLGAGLGAGAQALADPRGGLLPSIFGGEEKKRRRRRRRALTASDRADIAFIQGLLGPKAGKDFSVTLIAGLSR